MDTTAILAAVADAQVAGLAVATAITVLIFVIKGPKWVRRGG